MKTEEIIQKCKSYDNEDLHFELKQSDKFLDESGKVLHKDLVKLIVGFANRDGGRIIIGVKDDGSPEGLNIFDRCARGDKSGIDKFKEGIINICDSYISPKINIEVNYHNNHEYEVVEIVIPKKINIPHAVVNKKGNEIEHRSYYLKTSHSVKRVTDTQLDWLFSKKNSNVEFEKFKIQITTLSDLVDMPRTMDNLGDRLVIQPESMSQLSYYLHSLTIEARENCKGNKSYKYNLMSEIVMYSILQTLRWGHVSEGKRMIKVPKPDSNFLLAEALEEKEPIFFDSPWAKMLLPENSEASISKRDDVVIVIIKNVYMVIELQLQFFGWRSGFDEINPYASIVRQRHGVKGQNILYEMYETYDFLLTSKIRRLFPEVMTKDYYDSYEFAKQVNDQIRVCWDINHFMKEFPHYRRLYATEYKVDEILRALTKEGIISK
jgi:hypothetical protein